MEIHSQTRQKIEEIIDSLIALLDASDGDCDLEDNGDYEPSIGGAILHGKNGPECDLEFDTSDDEWTGDEQEPSLGWSPPLWPFPSEAATPRIQERSA